MPEKPKILQVVADMRTEGFSDKKIIENLRQLGLEDDQIKRIMEVADRDVYSKFKREMGVFVTDRIRKSTALLSGMVDEAIGKRMDPLKKELMTESERVTGEFAKTVNEKTNDLAIAVKKVREESLRIIEEQKLARADIDLLLAGPSRIRLGISIALIVVGLAIVAYTIFTVTPSIVALDFATPVQGVILMATGAMYLLIALATITGGIYFSGKPGR